MTAPAMPRGRTETRAALLDALDELLAERGWAACSLQAIVRRAGLTTGAVYSTFGSRGALIAAAMLRRAEPLLDLPKAGTLKAAVTAYARTYRRTGAEPEGRNLIVGQLDLVRLAVQDRALAGDLRAAQAELIARLARGLAGHGCQDADAAALRMLAVLQGLTLQQVMSDFALPERVFVDAALNAVGLSPPGS
ncbi:MAG: TetR family transcriptional regulator [Mycobacteriales bacterium]